MACVVTREADAGVDVEELGRIDDPMSLARFAFATEEIADLDSLSDDARRIRFFEYWTLKEAYLKAIGIGLSERLDRVGFRLSDEGSPVLRETSSRDWQFRVSRPTPAHVMAVAARPRSGEDLRIVERWGVPLAD